IYEAMAYQTAKEIGGMATVLCGHVDAIVLTGGLAHSDVFCNWLRERLSWIAPILIYPGQDEMRAMVEGVLRVLTGEEQAQEY
ncbi:MAG TPA: butyrate kinase, partial [Anaerolineae bacterium]|nr:butyrate kinase [Anaerolineae bacterium]